MIKILALLGAGNPTTSGANTVMNYLRKLDKKTLSQNQMSTSGVTIPTTETDILNISGKGELFDAICIGAGQPTFRVYVDGVLKFEAKATSGTAACGILGGIHGINSTTGVYKAMSDFTSLLLFPLTSLKAYPYTGSGAGMFSLVPQPIQFNSSLRITWVVTGSNNGQYSINYAVEV